jgi:hypothetical protein
MKKCLLICAVLLWCCSAAPVHAKLSSALWEAVQKAYVPAQPHQGLETAHENLDPSKLKGYVVVMQGGIAAERAKRFISWDAYDYRGVEIDLGKGTVHTRRGGIYTFLQPGDVMAVARLDRLGDTVYVGLISPDIYTPSNRSSEKLFSRVTTMAVFKVPSALAKANDASAALAAMSAWLKPFDNAAAAASFAKTVTAPAAQSPATPTTEK